MTSQKIVLFFIFFYGTLLLTFKVVDSKLDILGYQDKKLQNNDDPVQYKSPILEDDLCRKEYAAMMQAAERGDDWGLRMFDAWGKMPSSMWSGNTVDMGSYDQCINAAYFIDENLIKGQYCLVPVKYSPINAGDPAIKNLYELPNELQLATCTPTSCAPSVMVNLLNSTLNNYNLIVTNGDFESTCSTTAGDPFDSVAIFAIAVFSITALIVIASTIYDVTMKAENQTTDVILSSFSIVRNRRRVFSMAKINSPDNIQCFNGLRMFSICFVVLRNGFTMKRYYMHENPLRLTEIKEGPFFIFFEFGQFTVDTFLVISGVLVTWSVLKELDRSKTVNLLKLYVNRYLRLTPAMMAAVIFVMGIAKHIGDGPIYKSTFTTNEQQCRHTWWSLIFYVQNIVYPTDLCISSLWFMNVNMQLFIVAPLLIWPLWKYGRKIIYLIVGLIVLSIGCTTAAWVVNDYRMSTFRNIEYNSLEQRGKINLAMYRRMGTFLIGVCLGYYMHLSKGKRVSMSKKVVALGWMFTIAIILTIAISPKHLYKVAGAPGESVWDGAIYIPFCRCAWALAVAWIIFSCHNGYGGALNTFLSLRCWQPVAKVSYSMYIVHFVITVNLSARIRTPFHMDILPVFQAFFADLVFSFLIGIIWTLAFETPFLVLSTLLFKKKSTPRSNKVTPHDGVSIHMTENTGNNK